MTLSPPPGADGVRLTKAMLLWLSQYRDGRQNDRPYPVNSVWTSRSGKSFRGLVASQNAGLIVSQRDATIRPSGWRHDITPKGRAALETPANPSHEADGE